MPELPDVDGFRRYLARHAAGERINAVDVLDPVMIRNRSPRAFSRSLEGKRFAGPDRHGKWLIAPVDGIEVLFHFGMTGLFRWSESGRERHPHDRVIFVCEQGELRYNNMRRFGGIWLAGDPQERDAVTGPLGPDALDLDEDAFNSLIGARRGGIKAALMDQRLIAGAGNLLSDEILWRARVHPSTPVAELSSRKRSQLYRALHETVSESIRYARVPDGARWLTRVRDERRPRCPRCTAPLRRATIAGRTAVWCPRCQRR